MHLIDVRDVYKIYNPGENQVNALDGVSLTIDEGEFVAIIGQSGSGIVNYAAAQVCWELGAKRVVSARELSLKEIR